jgi:hypothetical protein
VRKAWLIVLGLACAGCSVSVLDPNVLQDENVDLNPFVLRSGTSFGMCAGYCRTVLEVDSLVLTLTEVAQVTPLPTRTRTLPLALADWRRVRSLVDAAALKRLEGIHGCPDCADGGAEWIEIEPAGDPVRVTFEYGTTLNGIGALQAELRALRARFPR